MMSSGRLTTASSCKDWLQAIARRVAVSSGNAGVSPGVRGAIRPCMGAGSGLVVMVFVGGVLLVGGMAGPLAKHPAEQSGRGVGKVLAAGAGGLDEFLGDHLQPAFQVGAMLA